MKDDDAELHFAVAKAIEYLEYIVAHGAKEEVRSMGNHALILLRESNDPERGEIHFNKMRESRTLQHARAEAHRFALQRLVDTCDSWPLPSLIFGEPLAEAKAVLAMKPYEHRIIGGLKTDPRTSQ